MGQHCSRWGHLWAASSPERPAPPSGYLEKQHKEDSQHCLLDLRSPLAIASSFLCCCGQRVCVCTLPSLPPWKYLLARVEAAGQNPSSPPPATPGPFPRRAGCLLLRSLPAGLPVPRRPCRETGSQSLPTLCSAQERHRLPALLPRVGDLPALPVAVPAGLPPGCDVSRAGGPSQNKQAVVSCRLFAPAGSRDPLGPAASLGFPREEEVLCGLWSQAGNRTSLELHPGPSEGPSSSRTQSKRAPGLATLFP